jgi:hypothetical protein
MAEIKKINTDLQIEAGLLDGDGNSGTANQILISTGTGVDWVDGSGSSIIGGPYLPLSAGSSYPLTGDLYLDDGSGASPSLYFKNQSDNFWRYLMESGGNFSIKEGTSTRLTFQAGGNVGIGTDNPLNKLFVSANTAGDYAAFIENTNSTNGYGLVARTANTGTSSYAFAARAASSDIFVVRADGNVGIGTTSPGAKLDIVGGGTSTSPTLELNSSTSYTFNHAINAFNSNLTTGQNQIMVFGKAGSTKNSGYIGYKWIGDNSNENLVTIGH